MKSGITFVLLLISIAVFSQQDCFEEVNAYWKSTEFRSGNSDSNGKMDVKKFLAAENKVRDRLIGCQFPDFTVKSMDGNTIAFSELKGKVIVLNFWFKTCEPCVAEMPTLNRLVEDYKNTGVVFIAFSRDEANQLSDFLKDHRFDYWIIPKQFDIEEKFCLLFGYPEQMVIDRKGKVRKIFTGGFTDERAMSAPYDSLQPVINTCLKEY